MNKHVIFILTLITLTTFPALTESYNILAVVSLPLKSHYMAFQKLFRELANRGHSVTVMNNFPDDTPLRNLKFVDLKKCSGTAGNFTPLHVYEEKDWNYMHLYNLYRHFELTPQMTKDDCNNLFLNENAKNHLAEGKKYDVIFVEQFVGDCGLAYATVMFDAPIIGITSHVLLPSAYTRLGLPFDVSSDAFYFSDAGTNPNFYKKVESLLMNIFFNTIGRMIIQYNVYNVFNGQLPNVQFDIEELARERIKMMFAYQHFSLTGSRVLSPQVIEIGGIHIGATKPVPSDISKFMYASEHGVVYVSFGSNLKANTMSEEKLQEFLQAFKNIPQRVIWKYENATFQDPDIYAQDWLPQLDILCHSKVVAFVAHGGMLSLSEAAHCGKPVITVPFFGDQFANAAMAREAGFGITLRFDNITADNLAESIQTLTSPEMQANAKRISALWHDRPQPVMDHAIYWTEYVARHGDSPAPLPSLRSSWYERYLLDVAAVVFVIVFAITAVLYVIFKIIAAVFACFSPKSEPKSKTGKKKSKKE